MLAKISLNLHHINKIDTNKLNCCKSIIFKNINELYNDYILRESNIDIFNDKIDITTRIYPKQKPISFRENDDKMCNRLLNADFTDLEESLTEAAGETIEISTHIHSFIYFDLNGKPIDQP